MPSMSIVKKPFNKQGGVIFPPPGVREGGARVDFRDDVSFDAQIEWHGRRFAWNRGTECPCRGYNGQTDQFDPVCTNCNGVGYMPIKTPGYFIDPLKVGVLSPLQQLIVDTSQAMVIRLLPTSMATQPSSFQVPGRWLFGSVMLTSRAENKLGYYDRVIDLDDVFPYSQLVDIPADSGTDVTLKLRYPAEALNAVVTEDHTYTDDDVELVDGNVHFLTGRQPAPGTRVSVNYLCHPAFVVLDYVHMIRSVPIRAKRYPKGDPGNSPMGGMRPLPMQVVAKLEYLVEAPRQG